ncbi:MAG: hypothetical protein FJ098_02295 [Deltaproteobacteria bacterium]|nr:hypothetical protein [Deltaproteobacteria bacterium]
MVRRRFPGVLLPVLLVLSTVPAEAKDPKPKNPPAEEKPAVEPVWPSPLDPGLFDAFYATLPFGKDRSEFFIALRQRFEAKNQPLLKATPEAHERDKIKERMETSLAATELSWTSFEGQDTGYSVSVVSDDFRPHAGEAVVKHSEGRNSAYYFFSGGSLWKLVLCVETGTGFEALAERLGTIYQATPAEAAWQDPEARTGLLSAVWRDPFFELTAEAPTGIYRCNTLRWVYLPALEGVKTRRDAAAALDTDGSRADSILDQITREPDQRVDDVLDKVLKETP